MVNYAGTQQHRQPSYQAYWVGLGLGLGLWLRLDLGLRVKVVHLQ